MKGSSLKIGLIQLACGESVQANLSKTIREIELAAKKGAQIVCLQELFSSQYFCRRYDHNFFKLAESITGPTIRAISKIAKKCRVVIVVPFFEKRTAGVYHNSAVVIDADGTLLGTYRKMHIPDDPNFYEKFYFTPGDLGFKCFETKYAKIGVLICWDQWYPEAARLTALSGAQILFYPTAIGYNMGEKREIVEAQMTGWETVQRGHAVANEVYVVAVNRVGIEKPLKFWGNSFVCDPFGTVIARADEVKEQTVVVSCDLSKIEETRQHWPFFRDRRIDAYGNITQRFIDDLIPTKKTANKKVFVKTSK